MNVEPSDFPPERDWARGGPIPSPDDPYAAMTPAYPPPPEYFLVAPHLPAASGAVATITAAAPPAGASQPKAAGWSSATVAVDIFVKFILPIGSAVVSLAAYAYLFGWPFGGGLIALLLIHEMGHYVIIRAKGLPANWPVFIPLLGAYVAMRRMPVNARDEAEIAIAGPLAGAVAGIACLLMYEQTHLEVLVPLTYLNFLINLINLIPVVPLDGGRVVGAISRWIWPLGLIGATAGLLYTHNLLLVLLIWIGLSETISRFRTSSRDTYYHIPLVARAYITILYLGLAGVLTFGTMLSQQLLAVRGAPLF